MTYIQDRYNNKIIRKLIVISITLVILNLRPSILGQNYTKLLLCVLLGLTLFRCIVLGLDKLSRERVILATINVCFGWYIIINSLILGSGIEYGVAGVYVGITIVFVSLVCLFYMNDDNGIVVLKTTIYLVTLFSLSSFITNLGIFLGYYDKLYLKTIYVKDSYHNFRLFFPFSIVCSEQHYFPFGISHLMMRMTGFLREPGLYQLFLIYSFFGTFVVRIRFSFVHRALILMSLITTFSTAGFVNIIFCSIYYIIFVTRQRSFKSIALYAIVLLIVSLFTVYFLNAPSFGFFSKLYHESGLIRIHDIMTSLELFRDYPIFGVGFTYKGVFLNKNLNLFVGLSKLGLAGLVIHLYGIFYGIKHFYNKATLVLIIPMLLTSLISQPIYYTVVPIFLLFINTKVLSTK